MRKILLLCAFCLFLAGCAPQTNDQSVSTSGNQPAANSNNSQVASAGKCTPGSVTLEGYGDKGKRLASCFVEYPGEPSRHDKFYYIVEDICGQFTKEFVANLLGQTISKIEPSPYTSVYACRYYFNDQDYIWLNMDYLSVTNQKEGNKVMGRTISTDNRIKMEHFIATKADGTIDEIYLVLAPEKFVSINRSSAKVLDNDKLLDFAIKLANEIKNYK